MGQELKIRTTPENYTYEPLGMSWINVNGRVEENKNINIAEVNKAISIAIEQAKKYPKASVGIATPFKSQAEALAQAIPSQHRQQIKAGTVHSLQGDEKDIIILSLVVSTDCRDSLPRFINVYAPYLLNVATTRARSSLIVIGNRKYCLGLRQGASKSLLCYLGEYILA
jgi:superfamily I DNA and/or RNA helicase